MTNNRLHFYSIEGVFLIEVYFSSCILITQVIMGDRASAERACKDPNPIIDGRKANVNLAILGAKPRGNNITPGWYYFTTTFFFIHSLSNYLSTL